MLRRILRRAVRHGMRLGFEEPFLHRLVPVLGEVMGAAYRELAATRDASVATVRAEEEKFLDTLAPARAQVQEEIEGADAAGSRPLPGEDVFRLYDTHGLPLEVIREIAEEERMGIDEEGFERALEEQRQRSRAATEESQRGWRPWSRRWPPDGELGRRSSRATATQLAGARVARLAVLRGRRGPALAPRRWPPAARRGGARPHASSTPRAAARWATAGL